MPVQPYRHRRRWSACRVCGMRSELTQTKVLRPPPYRRRGLQGLAFAPAGRRRRAGNRHRRRVAVVLLALAAGRGVRAAGGPVRPRSLRQRPPFRSPAHATGVRSAEYWSRSIRRGWSSPAIATATRIFSMAPRTCSSICSAAICAWTSARGSGRPSGDRVLWLDTRGGEAGAVRDRV